MIVYCALNYDGIFRRLKPFDGIRLYNIRFRSVLRYTALYGFIRHSGIYWTIPAQAEKQTGSIFADFSAFCADMGKYPFLALKRLYGQIMALYGKLCRFGICPIVSEYPFQAIQYRQAIMSTCLPAHWNIM